MVSCIVQFLIMLSTISLLLLVLYAVRFCLVYTCVQAWRDEVDLTYTTHKIIIIIDMPRGGRV